MACSQPGGRGWRRGRSQLRSPVEGLNLGECDTTTQGVQTHTNTFGFHLHACTCL